MSIPPAISAVPGAGRRDHAELATAASGHVVHIAPDGARLGRRPGGNPR